MRILLRAGAFALVLGAVACSGEQVQQLAPAHAAATPAVVHFGEVPTGSTVARTVTLANTGQAALVVSALKAGGDFTVATAPMTIEGHGEAAIEVRFKPTVAGPRAGRLEISSNSDDGGVTQVVLDGTGLAPLVCAACNTPPAATCQSEGDLLVYEPAGTCVDGQCQYARRTVPCVAGCDGAANRCKAVACSEGGAVRITNDPVESGWPAVAWSGRTYGVAFENAPAAKKQVFFTRVTAGSALEPASAALMADGASELPALTWGDDSFGLVFANDKTGAREIYFSRLNEDGTVAVPPTRISSSGEDANLVSIAWAGSVRGEYGVAWQDLREGMDVFFTRVTPSGDKVKTEANVTNSPGAYSANTPSLVWTGFEYGLAWTDNRDGGDAQVYFERLTPEGVPVGVPTRVTTGTGTKSLPSLAWNGTKYGLAWTDMREGPFEAWFVELDDRGGKIGTEVRLSSPDGLGVHAHLAAADGRWAVAWGQATGANPGAYVSIFPDPAQLGAPQRLGASNGSTLITAGPGQFAVTWQDYAGTAAGDVFFRTVCP